MALIKPFRAFRPVNAFAREIAALPYDVYTTEEARIAVKDNPHSFLHVDKAEIDLAGVGLYDKEVYEKAAENLKKMIETGRLEKDARKSLYIYRLEMDGRQQTGLVALTSIDEYISGTIKKHEFTRKDKEDDRVRHIEYCRAHTGPIFLAYKSEENAQIKDILADFTENNEPAVSFDDGVKNTVWVIDNEAVIAALVNALTGIESLYIADGHHRNAAAVNVGLKMREQNKSYTGEEWFNYCLSVIFPENELYIMPYNRMIRDLNGLSLEELIGKVSEKFDVTPEARRIMPEKRHEFGMYVNNQWSRLNLKEGLAEGLNILESLDVSIVHDHIIEPLLGISDIRNDTRIDFAGGAESVPEIEKRVGTGEMAVGFSLHATSVTELIKIAEGGGIMPPKSTWFEPKLRSGLFIHKE